MNVNASGTKQRIIPAVNSSAPLLDAWALHRMGGTCGATSGTSALETSGYFEGRAELPVVPLLLDADQSDGYRTLEDRKLQIGDI